ncbi:MAG: glycosyltransferase family 2 protein [Oligoflexia bacterium]|nr:glycosyltransferase family 2 protein [Oligoflexia bacterium]
MNENQQPGAPFLSLVIPAYNESKRIARSLKDLKSFFASFGSSIEIILVIEKSTDNTVEITKKTVGNDPHFIIIANDVQRGKGYAVKTGMLKARGETVFFTDLDLSTPLVEVIAFLGHFESNPQVDILIGSRQHAKSQILKRQNPIRQKMGQMFNFFVQLFAVKGITDTQCGFKAFRKKTIEPIFSRQTINGFSFDVEILLLAQYLGYKTEVLPVKWTNDPDSKVHIIRDSLKMFFDLLRVKRLVKKTLSSSPPQKVLK